MDITFGQASLYAALGYGVVFFGLILLMVLVMLIGKYFIAAAKRQEAAAPAPAPAPAPTAPAAAPGSAGTLKLHNVDPKTAAMAMAIVADKMGKPINELRFISIEEVSE